MSCGAKVEEKKKARLCANFFVLISLVTAQLVKLGLRLVVDNKKSTSVREKLFEFTFLRQNR
jgi:hypothetical protein